MSEHEPAGRGQRGTLYVTATMQRDAVTAFESLLGSTEGSNNGSEQYEEPRSSS